MPLSLSLPYATKVTATRAWPLPTPTYGIPYGGGPKSGCEARVRPMKSMYALDCASTGAAEMSRFHQLSPGKRRLPPKSSVSWTPEEDPAGSVPPDGLEGPVDEWPPQPMEKAMRAPQSHAKPSRNDRVYDPIRYVMNRTGSPAGASCVRCGRKCRPRWRRHFRRRDVRRRSGCGADHQEQPCARIAGATESDAALHVEASAAFPCSVAAACFHAARL